MPPDTINEAAEDRLESAMKDGFLNESSASEAFHSWVR